jgi:hypothetical protein
VLLCSARPALNFQHKASLIFDQISQKLIYFFFSYWELKNPFESSAENEIRFSFYKICIQKKKNNICAKYLANSIEIEIIFVFEINNGFYRREPKNNNLPKKFQLRQKIDWKNYQYCGVKISGYWKLLKGYGKKLYISNKIKLQINWVHKC